MNMFSYDFFQLKVRKPMPHEPLQGLPLRNLDWKLLVMSTCASAKPMLDSAGFLSNSSSGDAAAKQKTSQINV